MPRRMPKGQLCVYCVTRLAAQTRDHVIPRSLWGTSPPVGLNLPTVPCCKECNHRFSLVEPHFMLLASMGRAFEHPVVQENWQRVRRMVRHNARHVAEQLKRAQPALYQWADGSFSPSLAMPFDRTVFDPIIEKIMRGLYWIGVERFLPPDGVVDVYPGLPDPLRELVLSCQLVRLGGGVFSARWGRDDGDEPPFAVGCFRFYDDPDKDFTVTVMPPDWQHP